MDTSFELSFGKVESDWVFSTRLTIGSVTAPAFSDDTFGASCSLFSMHATYDAAGRDLLATGVRV